MTVLVTENYGGYFEFRLCADKSDSEQLVTQECFDRHLLKLEDGSTRYYVPDNIANIHHNVTLQLPKARVFHLKMNKASIMHRDPSSFNPELMLRSTSQQKFR